MAGRLLLDTCAGVANIQLLRVGALPLHGSLRLVYTPPAVPSVREARLDQLGPVDALYAARMQQVRA